MMARNETAAKNFREFAQLFLDESDELDRLRTASPTPQHHVAPVRFVFSSKIVVRQADLPPGKVVRAWFPYPLLTPAVQNIRLVSAQPTGACSRARTSRPTWASRISRRPGRRRKIWANTKGDDSACRDFRSCDSMEAVGGECWLSNATFSPWLCASVRDSFSGS